MNLNKQFLVKYTLLSSNNIPTFIGFGSYGTVQLAVNNSTKQYVAIKKIPRKLANKESSIHSQLNHPNITKFIESYYDFDTNSTFLVLQYISNGNLHDYIKQNVIDLKLKISEICKIFLGICQGLIEIHKKCILHRDIKPANILLDYQNNSKICDFGTATINQGVSTQLCGTFQYLAQQMLQQKPYGHKIDVWAVGIMLYEVLQGKLPYAQKNITSLINEMQQPLKFTKNISQNFIEIISKILNYQPNHRPQLTQIIQFLNNVKKQNQKINNNLKIVIQQKQRFKTNYESQNSTLDQFDQSTSCVLKIKKQNLLRINRKKPRMISIKSQNLSKSKAKINLPEPKYPRNDQLKVHLSTKQVSSTKISIKNLLLAKKH